MKTILLFDNASANEDSPTFELGEQLTIVAVGMQPGDFITFEIVKVKAGARSTVCGCRLNDMTGAIIEGVEELQCPACESDTPQPVSLSFSNPTIVLDFPQNVLLRAIYHGTGVDLRTVTVWATNTTTQDLTDAMRGCPPVCCEDEDETWSPTGLHRCGPEDVEIEEVSNCGNHRWVVCGDVLWTDTGRIRCLAGGVATEIEQTNQCNQRQWVAGPAQVWTDTGQMRCLPDGITTEIEQTNQCGERRWTAGPAQAWVSTCCRRCTDLGVEEQETNQCGQLRWVVIEPVEWQGTGVSRCTEENHEVQEINQCGIVRWVIAGPLEWVDTGLKRCDGPSLSVESQQINQCGESRWNSGPEAVVWINTGVYFCDGGIYYAEERSQCGTIRWIDTGEPCPPEESIHTIASVVAVSSPVTEGSNACWNVTLNSPVTDAPLTINFTLSGAEQGDHSYPAPSLVLPIGQSSGIVCVATTDDATVGEPLKVLGLKADLSARVTASPVSSHINVLDNDSALASLSFTNTTGEFSSILEGATLNVRVTLNQVAPGGGVSGNIAYTGSEKTAHPASYPDTPYTVLAGATTANISVPIADGDGVDGNTALIGTLSVSTGGWAVGVDTDAASVLDIDDPEGPGGPGGCYIAGTIMCKQDGYGVIDDLETGDDMLGFWIPGMQPELQPGWAAWTTDSIAELEYVTARVTSCKPFTATEAVCINGGPTTTPDHRYFVEKEGMYGWVEAGDLRIGYSMVTTSGLVPVETVALLVGEFTFYALDVEMPSTLIAHTPFGDVLAHNVKCGDCPGM